MLQGASSSSSFMSTEVHSGVNQTEVKSSNSVESVSTPKASPSAIVYSETGGQSDEEEEDEFAQLARRYLLPDYVSFIDISSEFSNATSCSLGCG